MTAPAAVSIQVREARAEDVARLRALFAALAQGRADALPAGDDVAAEVLARILAQPNRWLLVAEVGGQVAGTVDLLVVDNLTHGGRPWAVIENVVVAEARRRQGIATALIQAAIDRAKAANCYKVQLISGKQRTWAHAFYRTLGMEAVGEGFKLYFP